MRLKTIQEKNKQLRENWNTDNEKHLQEIQEFNTKQKRIENSNAKINSDYDVLIHLDYYLHSFINWENITAW